MMERDMGKIHFEKGVLALEEGRYAGSCAGEFCSLRDCLRG